MPSELKEIQEYAAYLKGLHAERNTLLDALEKMYLMTWDDEARVKRQFQNVKITLSPDARNKLLGAYRLLIATGPIFSVPSELNEIDEDVSNKLEKAAADIVSRAGRMQKKPLHHDVVLSALLFGEIHLAVTATADMVAYPGGSRSYKAQAEQASKYTPYLFDVLDPRNGYPDIGSLGLNAYYQEAETSVGAVKDEYGEKAAAGLGTSRFAKVTLCHWWDYDRHVTWISGRNEPLVDEAHGLPFIPFVVQLVEGSKLFGDAENQRQPFLYTLYKSHWWEQLNTTYTVMSTMTFGIGANPQVIVRKAPDGSMPEVLDDLPGGWIVVPNGGGYEYVMSKGAIDPSIFQLRDIAINQAEESTIYGQSLGEPLGGSPTFSMTALLHQAGRLPLIGYQRASQYAMGAAVKMAIDWMKLEPPAVEYGGAIGELDADTIPEAWELEASLEISLPQDQLRDAQVANAISTGEDPLVSKSWAREKVLKIEQPGEMQLQVWGEKSANLYFQKYVLDQMAKIQQMMQQVMNPQAPPPIMQPGMQGQPGQQQPGQMQPGQMPPGQGQMPPDLTQQSQQPGFIPGAPNQLPPEQAQYGGGMPLGPGEEEYA